MVNDSPNGATPSENDDVVQRNFGIRASQDEFLRERAHRERRAKADIVRDALDEYMARHPEPAAV